ncbi:MAG: response regulator [Magnetococcus sp. YQC-9]
MNTHSPLFWQEHHGFNWISGISGAVALVAVALLLTSYSSYLLFHTLAELFSIIIAFTFFIITWNGRRFFDNHYLLFLGMAFLFIGLLDLLHTMGYKGMGIFVRQDANLAPQLWIGARYLEAMSFIAACFFVRRQLPVAFMLILYTLSTSLLLLSIFVWESFPDCWVEGVGLTPFKKNSEYLISLMLLVGMMLLHRQRSHFSPKVLTLLRWAQLATVGAELAFTFYVNMYGFSNLVGHLLKIIAFYLFYKAVVETTLVAPFKTLFHNISMTRDDLSLANQELSTRQKQLEMAQEIAHLGHWHWDIASGHLTWSGETYRIFGLDPERISPSYALFLETIPATERHRVITAIEYALANPESSYRAEHSVLRPDGTLRHVMERGEVLREQGQPVGMLGTVLDLTEQKQTELDLEQARRFLLLVLDAIPSRVFWKDRQGIYLGCNRLFAQDAGFVIPEEIVGKTDHEMIWYTQAVRYGEVDRLVMDTGLARLNHEEQLLTGKQEMIWTRISKIPLRNESGQVIGVLGSYEDISESRKAQQSLASNETRLRHAFDAIDEGVWDWEIPSGQVHFSPRWTRLFGCEEESNEIGIWRDRIHPDDQERVQRDLNQHLLGMTPHYRSEHRMRHSAGHWLWILEQGKVVERDESGRAVRLIAADLDLTHRHQVEEQIHILSQAVEQSSTSIVITDPMGTIEYVNPTFVRTCGFSQEELLGNNPGIVKSGLTSAEVYRELWRTITAGQAWQGEICNRQKNGELYWELTNISPIRGADGTITHYLGIKDDITEKRHLAEAKQQALERAEQASRAKSEFLANMSHEIRTPLNAIINLSHLLQLTTLTAKQSSYLQKVEAAGRSLLGVINDILDFSKIEADRLELERIPYHLEDVIGNVANIAGTCRGNKPLELLCHLDPLVPWMLIGDPLRLGQVLINLTNNAIKFTDQGEVVIRVEHLERVPTTEPDLKERIRLRFSVRDTGIGISSEQQARLFQAFSQADGTITRKYGGTGLGLAISRRLVELMGSALVLESSPGHGSTFSFILEEDVAVEKESSLSSCTALEGVHALVVDDNPTAQEILKSLLESFRMRVTCASGGLEALEVLERTVTDAVSPVRLILMDYQMPDLDGLETIRRIRTHPELASIPEIIMVTAHPDPELQKRAERSGVDGFLLKPVSPSMLLDAILEMRGEAPVRASSFRREFMDRSQEQQLQTIRGARVLLVEDNPVNQEIGQELLHLAAMEVTVAACGRDALALLAESPAFDLVLMDIQMPEMDGFEVTRRIRADDRFAALPVVAMTAHAMASDREKALSSGMQDHISKPIEPSRLFAALLKWIPPRGGASEDTGASDVMASVDRSIFAALLGLPGVDGRLGLMRLGGNPELYRKMLHKFVLDQGELITELSGFVEEGRIQEAQFRIHAVKGVAGSLGMVRVQEAGQALETLLAAEGRSDPWMAMTALQEALDEVLAGLLGWIQREGKDSQLENGQHPTSGESLSVEQARLLVDEICFLLEEDYSAAEKRVEPLSRLRMGDSKSVALLSGLRVAMERYDTDDAGKILNELKKVLVSDFVGISD